MSKAPSFDLRTRVLAAVHEPLFRSSAGTGPAYSTVTGVFLRLTRSVGLRGAPGEPGPRIHDLRHSFAVSSLEKCGPDRQAVIRHMVGLNTYLGQGVMSPSETAAFALIYLLIVGICRQALSVSMLLRCLGEAYRITASILVIVAAAAIFSRALTLARFPQLATEWFLQLSDDPIVILLVINLVVLLVGLVMETIAALLLLTPVLLSVTTGIGVDPIQMGVILVFNLTIDLFTPPLGVGVFTIAKATGVRPELVFCEMLPLYLPLLLALAAVTFVPSLSLALL